MKKKKKCYISAKGIKRADYQRALAFRYNIIYTDSIEDADYFVVPVDNSRLNKEQLRELDLAKELGITTRLLNSEYITDSKYEDVDILKMNYEEINTSLKKSNELIEEDDIELELM